MIMVIVVMTITILMVTILMSVVLINFRMKTTNREAQKNFYTAETALEEIRLGLCEDLSAAAAAAYADTLQKYGELDGEARNQNFSSQMTAALKEKLQYQSDGTYSIAYLNSMLKQTAYNEETNVGAIAVSEQNFLDFSQEGMTLKNVKVTFYGEKEYVSSIKTDICLTYPQMDFLNNAEVPEVAQYALVASEHLAIEDGKKCEITGNAYIGNETTEISQGELKIQADPQNARRGLVISGGTLKGSNGASIQINGMELWGKNLVVDSSSFKAEDSAVYLQNDFIISNSMLTSAQANLAGEFYGYGNVETAVLASSAENDEDRAEKVKNNLADYSSSIIINGIRSKLDLSGLDAMKISGTSYVDSRTDENSKSSDILMGESLSIRSDQTAYLIPAECIAPEAENGGTNPMPISQYSALVEELNDAYGKLAASNLVDYDYKTRQYGSTLRNLGVGDYQIAALQVSGIGSMVYVFMKFDTTEQANAFFRSYYDTQNSARLGEILDLYTDGGVKLPQEVQQQTQDARFFFQGNILASGDANLYFPDRLSTVSQAQKEAQRAEEIAYQDNYAALNTKLLKQYEDLTVQERKNSVYENLVKEMISADDSSFTIGNGSYRLFVRSTGEAAIVANGDFAVNAENLAALLQENNANLSLIIASGTITVEQDFTGLLLAGEKISVKKDVKLTADAAAVERTLLATDENGKYVFEYLVNGESYISAQEIVDLQKTHGESIHLEDYVTYENWSKQ